MKEAYSPVVEEWFVFMGLSNPPQAFPDESERKDVGVTPAVEDPEAPQSLAGVPLLFPQVDPDSKANML